MLVCLCLATISRCRCTAERSTRRGDRDGDRDGDRVIGFSNMQKKHTCFSVREPKPKRFAPTGNRTRVCTVAGYYSTTRPSVLFEVYWLLRVATQVIYSYRNFWTNNPSRETSVPRKMSTFFTPVSPPTCYLPPRADAAADAAAELSPNCTLNPKPNTPPCFRVKLLFEC